MIPIDSCRVPANSFLARYAVDGNYTDCYSTIIASEVSLAEFATAFYTTRLFKLERTILKWAVSKPSTDLEARRVADGLLDTFAAWTVEQRNSSEILMCDFRSRTRSWLKVELRQVAGETESQLFFGSAMVQRRASRPDKFPGRLAYNALIGFHKMYSRLLLRAAKDNLRNP
jgi:hypothetical protein